MEKADAVAPSPTAVTQTTAIDACALLSKEEIASVQGDAPAQTQLVGQSEGGLAVSQCNFLLPVGTNSISLQVVQRAEGPNARDPKQVWQETFHQSPPDAAKSKRARPLQRVDGVGEEAFWVGDLKTGAFYVLKGNSYIRITVGGEEDMEAKLKKSSALAQMILPRL